MPTTEQTHPRAFMGVALFGMFLVVLAPFIPIPIVALVTLPLFLAGGVGFVYSATRLGQDSRTNIYFAVSATSALVAAGNQVLHMAGHFFALYRGGHSEFMSLGFFALAIALSGWLAHRAVLRMPWSRDFGNVVRFGLPGLALAAPAATLVFWTGIFALLTLLG